MKKSFLILASAFMLGLASCGGGDTGGGNTPTPTPGGNIPTEEGKFTIYFTPGAETPEMPEYAGYFVTGNFNDWATATAPELLPLEGTEYYYTMIEVAEGYDWESEKALEYKITLGYKADSGAPTPGVSWNYESDIDKSYEYGTNPKFEKTGSLLACGTHTWSAVPGPVVKISNVTIQVTLAESAPEWVKFSMPGDWDWTAKNNLMQPVEGSDRKVWTITIATDVELVAGDHEGQMLMHKASTPDDELDWSNKLLGNKADNYHFSFSLLHSNATYNFNEEDMDLEGEPLVVAFLPDPDALQPIALTIRVVSPVELNDGLVLAGDFNSWGSTALATEDNLTFEVVFDSEAGFMSSSDNGNSGGLAIHAVTADWHHKIQPNPLFKTLEGDTLVTITLTEAGAEYFNTPATEAYDELAAEEYTVTVQLANAR
jgi:hypothetical protein